MNFVSKIKENPLLIFQAILIVLLIALAIVFMVVMVSENPEWSFKLFGVSGSENRKYEVLKFLGIGMGGILVALQALASHRRAKALEDTASHTEQGLRQERLKNAIEHLGHESDSVRLGGAYELFHLAKDAKEDVKELRQTVLDILCAHIRWTTGKKEYQENHESKPTEEIQSMLRLLFVQEYEVFNGLRIELQGSYLKGADLRKARLQWAILTGVHLQKANFRWAQLQGTNLEGAQLQETNLHRANLQEAELRWANLQGAELGAARLQGVDFFAARLQVAILYQAHLQGTNLHGAKLQRANLIEA